MTFVMTTFSQSSEPIMATERVGASAGALASRIRRVRVNRGGLGQTVLTKEGRKIIYGQAD